MSATQRRTPDQKYFADGGSMAHFDNATADTRSATHSFEEIPTKAMVRREHPSFRSPTNCFHGRLSQSPITIPITKMIADRSI
jgi:hypothetical protein